MIKLTLLHVKDQLVIRDLWMDGHISLFTVIHFENEVNV